ncbi:MAG: DUF485 domain-containing protein [Sphingomonadales bacterium]
MSPETIDAISSHPEFQLLKRKRGRLVRLLSGLTIGLYGLFIAALAYMPGLITQPLGDGVVTTVGILFSFTFVISLVVMLAIYVRRANQEFDLLTQKVLEDIK